jgi:hypothetical protein
MPERSVLAVTRFTGTHITAWLEGKTVRIRNNDNICSATIASGSRFFGIDKVWEAFIQSAVKEMTFADATDFFNKHGISMAVRG